MIVYGYAKGFRYSSYGTLEVQVRVPGIHGPFTQEEYRGMQVRNYTMDANLPYYQSLILPRNPNDGDVVMLITPNEGSTDFIVLGLTGGSWYDGYVIGQA